MLLAYKIEWSESDTRLLLIDQQKLGAQMEALGGKKILAALKAAHKEYGLAIGVTATSQEEAATVREKLDAFVEAVRAYVVQVSASVRPKAAWNQWFRSYAAFCGTAS